ncbi:MAG: hypothetical protein IK149_00060 [Oscillospiraceae bacterium]|nr:hypothetical protein [Oscillospiraceae bacterium]
MLSINPSELIWTILCFLALLFLLNRFLYRPLVRFMDERKARIDAGLNEERAAQAALDEEARGLEREREEQLQEGRRELLAEKSREEERRLETMREAKLAAAEAVVDARAEAEELHSETMRELDHRRDEISKKLARRLLDAGNTEQ